MRQAFLCREVLCLEKLSRPYGKKSWLSVVTMEAG